MKGLTKQLQTCNNKLDKSTQGWTMKSMFSDTRYESIMSILTKLVELKEQQSSATIHTDASSSGITWNPSSMTMITTPVFHVVTPVNTPVRHSTVFSQTPTHPIVPATMRNIVAQPPSPYPPYLPNPTIFSTTQNYNIPFLPQVTYPTFHKFPHYPHFESLNWN